MTPLGVLGTRAEGRALGSRWNKGERDRAVEVVRDALARYGDTVRGDDLKRTLAHVEREREPAPRGSK